MSVDEILDERKKLEEVMLLKTYVKEETINKYVYKLLSPLSCSQFLKNEVYSKIQQYCSAADGIPTDT